MLLKTASFEAARILTAASALPGANPEIVAERLGLKVIAEPMPEPLRGWIVRGQPTIYVSSALRGRERAFAIAHEIAEYSLSERLSDMVHERYCDMVASVMLGEEALPVLYSCAASLAMLVVPALDIAACCLA